jgi:hypothetical protein
MFRMGDWQPVAERSVTMEGTDYEVFLWIVPANISGRWRLNSRPTEPAVPHTFIIEQEFQRFTLRRDDRAEIIGEGTMSGNDFTLSLAVADEKKRLTFTGSLDGDSLTLSTPGKRLSWKAKRAPGTETPVEKPARK